MRDSLALTLTVSYYHVMNNFVMSLMCKLNFEFYIDALQSQSWQCFSCLLAFTLKRTLY